MQELIEKLKAAEQNASGMFEIDEDTICAMMAILTAEPVAYLYSASFERGWVEGQLTDAPGCDMPVYSLGAE